MSWESVCSRRELRSMQQHNNTTSGCTEVRSSLTVDNKIHYDGIQMQEKIINQTRRLHYYVPFPVKSPLPKITKIKFNNQIVCNTKVSPSEGNAIITVVHSMKDGQRKENSSPSVTASGSPSVLGSSGASDEPGWVPDLSEEPPLVQTRPTARPHKRRSTTTKTTTRTTKRATPQYGPYTLFPSTTKPPPSTTKPPPSKPKPPPSTPKPPSSSMVPPSEKPKKEYCGMSVRPQNLMLGGRDVENGDWPWVATLHDVKTTVFKCAGVLVSKRFVVVAAHCVVDPIQKTKVKEDKLVLIMGKYDFSKWAERDMQAREVRRIILPPGFSATPQSNDIALLYLEDDVDYTMYARPICLLDEAGDIDSLVNQVATVVGWNPEENLPRRALVPIVSRQECQAANGQDDHNTFCAGNATVSKHCVGDADAGLFLPKVGVGSNLRWYLRGVPSSDLQNDLAKCARGGYVVYTDAAQFTPWIREVVRTTRPYHD